MTDITSSQDFLLSTNIFENNLNTFANDVNNGMCQAFDNGDYTDDINVSISLELHMGLELIPTGYCKKGELTGHTFDASSFKLYAYGQADPLNLPWCLENQYFNVSGLTPPQYYTLEFSYMLLCPYIDSRFSCGLYEVTYGYTYDNDSGTDIYGEVYKLIWELDTSSGSNDAGNVQIEYIGYYSIDLFCLTDTLNVSNIEFEAYMRYLIQTNDFNALWIGMWSVTSPENVSEGANVTVESGTPINKIASNLTVSYVKPLFSLFLFFYLTHHIT